MEQRPRIEIPDELLPHRLAGVVVLRRFPDGWRLLVLRAYRNWDFATGAVEDEEDFREAAAHEVLAQTGVADLRFHWGDAWKETLPYRGSKVTRYYIAESPADPVRLPVCAELGRPEHDEFRWVGFETAEDVLPPRLSVVLDWVRELAAGTQSTDRDIG